MENIFKELQKLQIEINDCEAQKDLITQKNWGVTFEDDADYYALNATIERNRKRMEELLLNEIPVNDVEAA